MSIDNTQWADYDNRTTFDYILTALRPWGYTDESWGNDACPKITLLGDAMHEHDINLFVGWADEEMNKTELSDSRQFALSMDCNFQRALGQDPFRCFYLGDNLEQLIKVAKQIAPAQETYRELLQRGYEIISTGGGCTAWGKNFGDHLVMVTGDNQASLISTLYDDEGTVEVDELVTIGVYDNGSPIWGDGTDLDGSENYSWVRVGDTKGLAASLEVAETIAHENGAGKIDLMAGLADVYSDMLRKHYRGLGDMWSADDLYAEHSGDMSPSQRETLQAFMNFWDALQKMEDGRS